jgi:hypothetical protein
MATHGTCSAQHDWDSPYRTLELLHSDAVQDVCVPVYTTFSMETAEWVSTKTSNNELIEGNEREMRGSMASDERREMVVKENTAAIGPRARLEQSLLR